MARFGGCGTGWRLAHASVYDPYAPQVRRRPLARLPAVALQGDVACDRARALRERASTLPPRRTLVCYTISILIFSLCVMR